MTALKRILSLVFGSCILISVLSCGNSKPPLPPVPLIIDPTPLPVAVINVPYSVTIKAAGGVPPYTWGMASGILPPGLTISAGGVISGTPTTLGTTNFKIQVTDVQTPKQAVDTASKTITVNAPLAISTTSLTAGTVGVPYSSAISATGGLPPYTWSITSGVLPAGLTLAGNGVISGTPTTQETQTFTVQVSDSQTPAATASAPLTLTITGPTGRLNGNYVFSFSGYQNGSLVLQAGSFTSDGAGNITNGLMDSNSATGVHTSLPFSGTYSIGSANTGPMTLLIPALGTFTYQVAVPAGGNIRFIQNGTAGDQGSGYIRKVNSTTKITLAQLAAFWIYGANGADAAANRYSTAGTFQSDNTGAWSTLESDSNDNGSVTHDTTSTGKFTSIDPVTQRGTATVTTGSVTTNYSFYPVSTTEMVMLSVDPVSSSAPLGLFSLSNRPQNNYTNASITVTTVAELQGLASSNTVPYAALAFAAFDGKGAVTVSTDENVGGTLSANNYAATYNVATNGRTTVTGFGTNPVVFYLGGSVAYILVSDAGVTSGSIVPQFSSPYTNSSINGSYQGGTLQAVLPTVTVEDDSAAADGAGNLALTFDTSGPGGPQNGLIQALTYSVDSAGRAPLVVSGTTVGIAYVVNGASSTQSTTGKVWVLSTDANPKINSIEK